MLSLHRNVARDEKKQRELKEKKRKALDPDNKVITNLFSQLRKLFQAEEMSCNIGQKANITANVTSQEVGSINEEATTIFEKEEDVDISKDVLALS